MLTERLKNSGVQPGRPSARRRRATRRDRCRRRSRCAARRRELAGSTRHAARSIVRQARPVRARLLAREGAARAGRRPGSGQALPLAASRAASPGRDGTARTARAALADPDAATVRSSTSRQELRRDEHEAADRAPLGRLEHVERRPPVADRHDDETIAGRWARSRRPRRNDSNQSHRVLHGLRCSDGCAGWGVALPGAPAKSRKRALPEPTSRPARPCTNSGGLRLERRSSSHDSMYRPRFRAARSRPCGTGRPARVAA